MVDRIRELISVQQLTPTQFADRIGVARPIVSHILSGRNKPSLEVVQKIIAGFPEVAMPWLLTGAGPMLATAAPALALVTEETDAPVLPRRAAKTPETRRPALRNATPESGGLEPRAPVEAVSFEPPKATLPPAEPAEPSAPAAATTRGEDVAAMSPAAAPPTTAAIPILPAATAAPDAAVLHALTAAGKRIRRIVIFYHDGTFADYQPEAVE